MGQPDHSTILAIDPGLTGALAWMRLHDGRRVELLGVADVPTYLKKHGNKSKPHIDLPALARLVQTPRFDTTPTLAVIEDVGAAPGQGVTSMFRFGYTAGALAGICAASDMDVTLIRPQVWQRWARVPRGADTFKNGHTRAKTNNTQHATEVFNCAKELLKRKKDHNRADAILIGYGFFSQQIQAVPEV